MKVKAPFELEFTKPRNAELQVIYIRGCRIVHYTIGGFQTVRDWCEDILFWRPGKGVNR